MNPIIEEKVKIQKKLSLKAGSVSEYIKMMQKNMEDVEERFGIVLNRPMKAIKGGDSILLNSIPELK